jgi:CheY-like chemotaxis protein
MSARTGGNIILLVEDDSGYAFVLRRLLKINGFTDPVIWTKDGSEAMDWLRCTGNYHDRDGSLFPAFVLSDVKMPGVNGYELLRLIRADKLTAKLPVIIMSSVMNDSVIQKCFENGANGCMEKSADGCWVAQELRRILGSLCQL